MGNFNEDIRSEDILQWKYSMMLWDVVIYKTGEDDAPRIYQKGSDPIDTRMCSTNI